MGITYFTKGISFLNILDVNTKLFLLQYKLVTAPCLCHNTTLCAPANTGLWCLLEA